MSWPEGRVREMVELFNGYPFDSSTFDSTGDVPLVRIRDLASKQFETYVPAPVPPGAVLRSGDLVIGMDGDFNAQIWSRGDAALNQRLCALRPRPGIDIRWVFYNLPAHLAFLHATQYATTVKHLSSSEVLAIRFAVPNYSDQVVICNFLDRETAKIDALIDRQEQLIATLREDRAATITHAVTKGLKPGVAQAPSGIQWMGDVPAHWEVARLRHHATMKTGHTPSRQKPEFWENTHIPWFTLADVWQLRSGRQIYLGETAGKISSIGLANSAAELLPAGTVILSRTASVGFSGIMPIPMATSQDFWNWICGPRLIPEFLAFVFRAMKPYFDFLMMGSTHQTIYQADAAALQVPLPPVDEQNEIVEALKIRTRAVDSLIDKSTEMIETLREYRSALITNAVTGKIDVREAV